MKFTENNMRKKASVLPRLTFLLMGLFVTGLLPLQAQDSDFVTWNKMKARHAVSSRVELTGDIEMRTRDALEEIDRWGFGIGASVRLLPFLKAEGGYELHYRNRGEEGWKTRHRYYAGATGTLKTGRWTLSLRERVQHTFDGRGTDEFRIRTRLKAAYKVTSWSPYISLEQYHSLNKNELFHAARFRARGGVEARLSSRWTADIFYCYQHESDKDRHILGWELNYKF